MDVSEFLKTNFEQLRLIPETLGHQYNLSREEIEEVFQNALKAICKQKLDPSNNLRAYWFKTVHGKIIDLLRTRNRVRSNMYLENYQLKEKLEIYKDSFHTDEFELLRLYFDCNSSPTQVAQKLKLERQVRAFSRIKTKIDRAKQKLLRHLKKMKQNIQPIFPDNDSDFMVQIDERSSDFIAQIEENEERSSDSKEMAWEKQKDSAELIIAGIYILNEKTKDKENKVFIQSQAIKEIGKGYFKTLIPIVKFTPEEEKMIVKIICNAKTAGFIANYLTDEALFLAIEKYGFLEVMADFQRKLLDDSLIWEALYRSNVQDSREILKMIRKICKFHLGTAAVKLYDFFLENFNYKKANNDIGGQKISLF